MRVFILAAAVCTPAFACRSDAGCRSDPSEPTGSTTASTPPANPLTDAEIRDLAAGTAHLNGRAQLEHIEYVQTTRQTARDLIFGNDDGDPDN